MREGPDLWSRSGPSRLSVRHQDCVDHVDHAVAGENVRGDDSAVVDPEGAFVSDSNGLAVDGFYMGTVLEAKHVCGEDFGGQNVIGENAREGVSILRFEQVRNRVTELCKSFIGWGKDGEWTIAHQRFG